MKRSKQGKSDEKAVEEVERAAVAGARNALAQVIADGSHSDRSCAIEAIQSIDRGWRDDTKQYSVTYRLSKCFDARFNLLGSFAGNSDEISSTATTQMRAALYALDHLTQVLLAILTDGGVAIYPTTGSSEQQLAALPAASKDPLLSAIEDHQTD
ncbi:MAG: hypothetical protein OXH78_07525 [Acidimicrobiaceae bacterium]|nr:hypothetical protein [Acidimicrobiaceae bacterium]